MSDAQDIDAEDEIQAAVEAAGTPDAATPEELIALVRAAYSDAADFADSILAPERERAFDYFLGDLYTRSGDVETAEDVEGQSAFVIRDVQDSINMMLPGLIRIFTAGEDVVQFAPRGPDDEEGAQQRTDYVNLLLDTDGNNWFTTLHDAVHDALLKKLGVIKWWWDERVSVTMHEYRGLTPMQAAAIEADPECEVIGRVETAATGDAAGSAPAAPGGSPPAPPGAPPAAPGAFPAPEPLPPPVFVDMAVKRTSRRPIFRIAAVPPEEFVIARDARDVSEAAYCAHRTLPTVSDLVAEGFDRDLVELHAKADLDSFGEASQEAEQRNPGLNWPAAAGGIPKSMWRVMHVEHFVRYDADGDGIAELHRLRTIGADCAEVIADEIVLQAPFSALTPVRIPHAVVGLSIADQTSDIQDAKSQIMRSTLDSLAQAIFPAMAVVENAVNMDDVANNEVGRIIRQNAPGMVQPLAEPFVGPAALGVLAYLDDVKASRTGITRASAGLDDKVLQSTTRTAVENTVERSQERVEMIARTFAETGIRDVFRGVLASVIHQQDVPRTVKLRGRWVEVDPRSWEADADVTVSVGLGRGTDQQRLTFLGVIAQKQEMILAQFGPGNPMVAPSQLRATYAEMMRLSGFKDAAKFFKEISPQDDARIAQQAAQAKPQDPAVILAEVEMMKAKTEQETAREKMLLEWVKAQQEDDRERDKLDAEIYLKAAELQARYGAQVDIAMIRAQVDADRNARAQQQQAEQMHHDGAIQRDRIAADAGVKDRANTMRAMAMREAAQQRMQGQQTKPQGVN